jgi:hypothetical protein
LRHPLRVNVAAALLLCFASAAEYGAFAAEDDGLAVQTVQGAPEAAFEQFLDRLMRAESNGRDTAANPRSTALGAYQFIESTFIAVARQHFAGEVAEMSDSALLELRTNRAFARRAAAAYSRQNAAYLSEQGIAPTFGHLRLAYLLGSVAAAKVLKAEPQTPVSTLLHPAAVRANPFLRNMTAAGLNERAHRDLDLRPGISIAMPEVAAGAAAAAADAPKCNQGLPSCRRWVALRAIRVDPAKATTVTRPVRAPAGRKASAKTS